MMIQPEELKSDKYLPWQRGRGKDVWAMIIASITGDLDTIQSLLEKDPGLINCELEYFTPMRFAVRENQRALVDFFLKKGVNPAHEIGQNYITMAKERGYTQLAALFEKINREQYHIVPGGKIISEAIKERDLEKVKSLIGKDQALVHAADERGNQPIHWAVLTRQIDMIDYLLAHGADIHAARPDGARPLDLTNGDYHYRSWYRDLPPTGLRKHEVLIGYLMARGAYCDISVAAKIGYYERVKQLLDEDPSLVKRLPDHDGYYSGVPLRNASGAGHIEIVKLLLSRGADPNQPEPGIAPYGSSLHSAISNRQYEIVKLLIEHGANVNAEVESSGNCLYMAQSVVGAPKEIIDLLVSKGARLTTDIILYEADYDTIANKLKEDPTFAVGRHLGNITSEDKKQIVELLLQYQPDLLRNGTDASKAWWDNSTPKTPEFLRWLFEKGLDPNRRNWLGITLLHRCAANNEVALAEICLEFGAKINAMETEWSSTPLGWAAKHGKKDMVEFLLENGADKNLPDDETWARPVEWAKRNGFPEIEQLLA